MNHCSGARGAAAEAATAALLEGVFDLALQPIRPVDGRSRRLQWGEVLVRPVGCSAVDLITYAEASGRAAQVDICIWAKALGHAHGLQRLSLNVSGQTLSQRDARWQLMKMVDAAPLMAGQVVLEITETCLVSDVPSILPFLRAMRSVGVSVALDDVSSTSLMIPIEYVDYIKLDRRIVAAGDDSRLKELCKIAAASGSQVIAEGVETSLDLRRCASNGVQWFQGYYDRGEGAPLGDPCRVSSKVSRAVSDTVLFE